VKKNSENNIENLIKSHEKSQKFNANGEPIPSLPSASDGDECDEENDWEKEASKSNENPKLLDFSDSHGSSSSQLNQKHSGAGQIQISSL
jgi:hypothetical protein